MINTSNTKDDFQTWFGNKSANETNLDLKKESNNKNNKNLEKKHFKTERKACSEVLK